MKDWKTLTEEERAEARSGRTCYENRVKMDDCLSAVLAMLKDNPEATRKAWKLPWGNYLINTAKEIAEYLEECTA